MQAVDERLRGELGGWSGAEIQLGIISVTVEIESIDGDKRFPVMEVGCLHLCLPLLTLSLELRHWWPKKIQ